MFLALADKKKSVNKYFCPFAFSKKLMGIKIKAVLITEEHSCFAQVKRAGFVP